MVHIDLSQKSEISDLQNTQIKYRFIKAMGFAPNAMQFLEDAYEEGQKDRIDYVEKTVSDYEKALKHKADSIARAEREKLERFDDYEKGMYSKQVHPSGRFSL